MKTLSFKKAVAAVAALSLITSFTAVAASAADVTIDIDRLIVTPVEKDGPTTAKRVDTAGNVVDDSVPVTKSGNTYEVPVFIRMTSVPSGGVNAIEFGFKVDERCSYRNINDTEEANDLTGTSLSKEFTNSSNGAMTWAAWAADSVYKRTPAQFLLVMVSAPAPSEADAAPKYDIFYQEDGISSKGAPSHHLFDDTENGVSYTGEGIDGWIEFEAVATTTTATTATTATTSTTTTSSTSTTSTSSTTSTTSTSSTTSTTSTSSTTSTTSTSTSATTTSTEGMTTTSTSEVQAPITESTRDTGGGIDWTESSSTSTSQTTKSTGSSSTSSTTKKTTTTTRATTTTKSNNQTVASSPKTGVADVLPIAGVAAAVAVLGGAAVVSKKKKD